MAKAAKKFFVHSDSDQTQLAIYETTLPNTMEQTLNVTYVYGQTLNVTYVYGQQMQKHCHL